jgi:hypothetical protein
VKSGAPSAGFHARSMARQLEQAADGRKQIPGSAAAIGAHAPL